MKPIQPISVGLILLFNLSVVGLAYNQDNEVRGEDRQSAAYSSSSAAAPSSIPTGGAVQDTPVNPTPKPTGAPRVANPGTPIPAQNGIIGTGTPLNSGLRGTDNPPD